MRKDNTEPRPFFCTNCKMAIGLIVKDPDFVERLNVFRVACMPEGPVLGILNATTFLFDATVEDYKGMFSVTHLDSGTVVCPDCNTSYEWNLSKAALERFLSRRRNRTFGLDV